MQKHLLLHFYTLDTLRVKYILDTLRVKYTLDTLRVKYTLDTLRAKICIEEYGCDDFINVHFNDRKSHEIYFHDQALR